MSLQDQIDARASEIHTDAYPMSIGELMNLYRDRELDLQPEFQRFFRWTPLQKSMLIESLLLGIPIPSIFVSQRDDGVWEVVDGLQRLSTIFQFAGILRDEADQGLPPTQLVGTSYLPDLEGKVWDEEAQSYFYASKPDPLTQAQRLSLKRTKLAINIIKKESAGDTKLELFHRLNSLGTGLSDQEKRNCLLLLKNREAFQWGLDLAQTPAFQVTTNLSDALLEQRYDVELVWRFACLRHTDPSTYSKISDMSAFTTETSLRIAGNHEFDFKLESTIFQRTFALLDAAAGEDAFRKYDTQSSRFIRSFLISMFETVALGVAHNISNLESMNEQDRNAFIFTHIKGLWSEEEFLSNMGSGKTPSRRLSHLVPFGYQYFAP